VPVPAPTPASNSSNSSTPTPTPTPTDATTPTPTPTPTPTLTTITQEVTIDGTNATSWVLDGPVYEKGYGSAIGIYIISTASYVPFASVASSISRRGVRASLKASMPSENSASAISAAQQMTADSLARSVNSVSSALGIPVSTAFTDLSKPVVGGSVLPAETQSSSTSSTGLIVGIVVGVVVLIAAVVVFFIFYKKKAEGCDVSYEPEEKGTTTTLEMNPVVAIDVDVSYSAGGSHTRSSMDFSPTSSSEETPDKKTIDFSVEMHPDDPRVNNVIIEEVMDDPRLAPQDKSYTITV